ncbi:TIR domain-containing protein [Flavobacterium aquiphilum]|uniref:TIR domain-containing protein n=1 Tax=Flavobacterium aquiphilum TaxID=3003261 RepID=UPI002480F594|nr:TIR domain-containing protein [Flavobacterium aquiphilum]
MKPKIFIGSSVAGLGVAYSIQQNLTHDADVTVWDQGVFELSKTTIESLLEILNKSDFGIFVFNEDDIATIKQETKSVVRDNVLFEFGLFIGKLTRQRVFFVIPANSELHLPTDLLGVTPGTYDARREDNSLQAATGPVCHQIRTQVQKEGLLNTSTETAQEPEKTEGTNNYEDDVWYSIFAKGDYEKAIKILEKQLATEIDEDEVIQKKIWISYCKFKSDSIDGKKALEELLVEFPEKLVVSHGIAKFYLWDDYYDHAISILEAAIVKFGEDESLILTLADCYKKTEGEDKVIEYLSTKKPSDSIDITLNILSILRDKKSWEQARKVVHACYQKHPNNEKIKYEYARIALDLNLNDIALFFLKPLTQSYDNVEYWGYLSNCYVQLNLYDLGMIACKRANEIAGEQQSWIILNIGNILKNKGFYTESIAYFEKGLGIDKYSEYGHERLSTAIKLKDEEQEKSSKLIIEGRKALRDFVIE